MSQARHSEPMIPMDDAELDDPDTGVIQDMRDSGKPEQVLEAHRRAVQKLRSLDWRIQRKQALKKR